MEVMHHFGQEQLNVQTLESKMGTVQKSKFSERLQRIKKSQMEYSKMFREFNAIVTQVKVKYALRPNMGPTHLSSSSGSSSMSTSGDDDNLGVLRKNVKRYWRNCDFMENIHEEAVQIFEHEFPKLLLIGNTSIVVLGPNGTQIESHLFYAVNWSSGATATRCLLSIVFSSDVLSTHTLTGKPSPAFYGRERPPKMQLDPIITADVIHCVLTKCGCNEREIRAAITTKCADTAKKYKRRLLKLQQQLQKHKQIQQQQQPQEQHYQHQQLQEQRQIQQQHHQLQEQQQIRQQQQQPQYQILQLNPQ